jgi:hypothetical protein
VRTESTKSNAEQPSPKKEGLQLEQKERIEEEPADSLERSLVNMFKPKKEDDTRSLVSNASKTSKSILDMSINELLAVRIPVGRTSRIEEEGRPAALTTVAEAVAPIEEEAQPVRWTAERRSVKVEEAEAAEQDEVRMNKDSILASNSSLMSSTHRQTAAHEEEVAPQKCAC